MGKTYTTKQKSALAAKIIKLAVEISETTPHDVFCDYSPHVKTIRVDIHTGGWKINPKNYTKLEVGFHDFNDTDAELQAIMNALEKLKEDAGK